MSGSINDVLRDILGRHGSVLLDDHRRCESCLRDTELENRDISGLIAALKAGIPKRLAAMPAGTLGDKGVANFAAELSEASGLSETIARRSVGAGAHALRPQDAATERKKEEEEEKETVEPGTAKPSLSEAIIAAIVIPVACLAAYHVSSFSVFGLQVPSWIFALIVLVKGGQSIVSYLDYRFGKQAQ